MRRRSFLGAIAGLGVGAVVGCTGSEPRPTPSPSPSASPVPSPSEPAVPEPAAMLRSRWTEDPYARGAVSYLPVGTSAAQRRALAEPVGDRVFFAGEATSAAAAGTVAGARSSGLRAAGEVESVAPTGERVVVVGAGAAGAAAARRLVDGGYEVTVLEARDRVGGRIDTRRPDGWDTPVELGAALVDSEAADELLARLARLDIRTAGLGDDTLLRTADGATAAPTTAADDALAAAAAFAAAEPADVSLASALTVTEAPDADSPLGTPPVTPAERLTAALRGVRAETGASPAGLSARTGLDDGARGGDRIVLGGFDGSVADELDGVDVWTANVVSQVAYDDEGVSIRIASGESLQADRIVVTVPLGVLRSRDIRFEPRLPASTSSAILQLGVGAVETVWLRFDEPFWDAEETRWTALTPDADFGAWINLEPLIGSPVLVGLVGGEHALAIADLDDAELVAAARRDLAPFLPGGAA